MECPRASSTIVPLFWNSPAKEKEKKKSAGHTTLRGEYTQQEANQRTVLSLALSILFPSSTNGNLPTSSDLIPACKINSFLQVSKFSKLSILVTFSEEEKRKRKSVSKKKKNEQREKKKTITIKDKYTTIRSSVE
jgi:hypothetical protein